MMTVMMTMMTTMMVMMMLTMMMMAEVLQRGSSRWSEWVDKQFEPSAIIASWVCLSSYYDTYDQCDDDDDDDDWW